MNGVIGAQERSVVSRRGRDAVGHLSMMQQRAPAAGEKDPAHGTSNNFPKILTRRVYGVWPAISRPATPVWLEADRPDWAPSGRSFYTASHFPRFGEQLFNHHTFVVAGDVVAFLHFGQPGAGALRRLCVGCRRGRRTGAAGPQAGDAGGAAGRSER